LLSLSDSVRESSGRVLVHCLAGISRSPTVVIAYVMHHLRLSIIDAYRCVYLYSIPWNGGSVSIWGIALMPVV